MVIQKYMKVWLGYCSRNNWQIAEDQSGVLMRTGGKGDYNLLLFLSPIRWTYHQLRTELEVWELRSLPLWRLFNHVFHETLSCRKKLYPMISFHACFITFQKINWDSFSSESPTVFGQQIAHLGKELAYQAAVYLS